uniref:Uncharacterized protein n=1 Tax=Amorphochlora amoebiformis TaxID=1561963 RepID=A0A7S0CNM9_9EUKA
MEPTFASSYVFANFSFKNVHPREFAGKAKLRITFGGQDLIINDVERPEQIPRNAYGPTQLQFWPISTIVTPVWMSKTSQHTKFFLVEDELTVAVKDDIPLKVYHGDEKYKTLAQPVGDLKVAWRIHDCLGISKGTSRNESDLESLASVYNRLYSPQESNQASYMNLDMKETRQDAQIDISEHTVHKFKCKCTCTLLHPNPLRRWTVARQWITT